MQVKPLPGQSKQPEWAISAKLHFGKTTAIMLPALSIHAKSLSEASDIMRNRSKRISELFPDSYLELLTIERGPITICSELGAPDPTAKLGAMMAENFLIWLQQ